MKIAGKKNGELLKQQRIVNNGGLIMTDKERFISLCSGIHREGIANLMNWLEHSDFYTAPASSRFHLCCEGGLLQHSLHVYDELKRLLTVYPEINVSEETILITSLFHDLCKVGVYAPKINGGITTYARKEELHYGGHGSKSVYLIQKFMKLTDEEAVAINCHMSCWDGNTTVGEAYAQFPFAWLLHVADESATYIVENN